MRQLFWSPIAGCTKVGPGCDNCCEFVLGHPCFRRREVYGTDEISSGDQWTGVVKVVEREFARPFAVLEEGATIWTAQMGDLFNPGVPDAVRLRVFGVMARLPQHLFVVTTKRPAEMKQWLSNPARPQQVATAATEWDNKRGARAASSGWPLPNLCIGVSFENQSTAAAAMPLLMETPAALRLAWVAPILGPVELSEWSNIQWIVCRGEEGDGRRAPDAQWVTDLKNYAVANGIPFHFRGFGDGQMEVDGQRWEQRP